MFGQIPHEIILLFMLYAGAAMMDAIACVYLLLRRGNAFASDVTPPLRLRRWTRLGLGPRVVSAGRLTHFERRY